MDEDDQPTARIVRLHNMFRYYDSQPITYDEYGQHVALAAKQSDWLTRAEVIATASDDAVVTLARRA